MAKILQGNFDRKKGSSIEPKKTEEPIPGYQFKLSVVFSDPLIWRRLLVPGSLTLADFHRVIQVCLGWDDQSMHQFLVGKIFYQPGFGLEDRERKPEYDEAHFCLHQLEESMQFIFTYLYDGGDGWELEITLEEILPHGSDKPYPVVLAGERNGPPEEAGDIHQFHQALSGYEADEKKHKNKSVFSGVQNFSPEVCDLQAINTRLREIGSGFSRG